MFSDLVVRTSDGFDIAFTLRSSSRTAALVTLLHGLSVDRHEYLGFYDELAVRLVELGYSVAQFDFRGHGRSSGAMTDFTIASQCIDTIVVVRESLRQLAGEPLPLHFVGTSFGAVPALYAGKHFEQTRSVTLLSPVLDYQRTFLAPETDWARSAFTPEAIRTLPETGTIHLDGRALSWSLIVEMGIFSPIPLISDLRSRLMLIHGDSDTMVPHEISRNIAISHQINLLTVKGMDHGFPAFGDDTGFSQKSLESKRIVIDSIVQSIERHEAVAGGRE